MSYIDNNGFFQAELFEACVGVKIYSHKKTKKQNRKFKISFDRLFADNYIKQNHKQIVLSDKGTLAATDKCWFFIITRENKDWLLSLVISIIAIVISVISLIINKK